ncbi:guanine deaminase isoform X2 [Ischnura elegans]|uniref:guanine deaminase isoform X2 n=1 Tax=Ischnura elegans TaxID=197161 RepID=UPI001ED89B71|nr:guanine deaminase isoform X2 [Ischnura elegans]
MASVKGSKVSAGGTDGFLYVGPYVHSIGLNDLQVIEEGVIAVTNGKICAVDSKDNLNRVAEKFGISEQNFHFLDNGEFLIPGFVDTHIHAPQYPNAGLGYDKPLLGWLDHYTFPMEAKYSDEQFAETIYNAVVKRTLSYGTTTACYFATIHVATAIVLADIVLKHGQRAFVGKVNMNVNHPSYYGESSENSLKDTETFVNAILSKKNDLIKPIITPRFAISCDMELMKKLSDIAKKHDVHIQTHISENRDEVKYVAELFPECKSYADVYDSAGLLTDKTILAHGVYLTDDEIKTIVKRSSSVSHCPTSNSCLRSGICHVRKLLQNGVQVGLGTDISGGYSPSIIEVMKAALAVSIDLSFEKDKSNQQTCALELKEVFYLATLGGARALRLDNKIGNFEIGKEFDALVVSLRGEPGGVDVLTPLNTLELLQKFVYLGDDRNVKKVYVSGKIVKQI